MTLGFWNLNNKDLSDYLVGLVNEKEIDILILAEFDDATVLSFLLKQKKINPNRKYEQISNSRLCVLSSLSLNVFTPCTGLINSTRWDAFHVNIPSIISFNLFGVHLPSKVNWSNASLAFECVNLARDISIVEEKTGVHETIVAGDFNMNPYEQGLVATNGLHALPDLDYTSNNPEGRVVDGNKYKYFYNPMWNFFGDKKLPYGTHYYRESGHVSQEWNIYDQIIYRPSLKKHIDKDDIEIITSIQGENLITALGRPDRKSYSDHLPIILNLTL